MASIISFEFKLIGDVKCTLRSVVQEYKVEGAKMKRRMASLNSLVFFY